MQSQTNNRLSFSSKSSRIREYMKLEVAISGCGFLE